MCYLPINTQLRWNQTSSEGEYISCCETCCDRHRRVIRHLLTEMAPNPGRPWLTTDPMNRFLDRESTPLHPGSDPNPGVKGAKAPTEITK